MKKTLISLFIISSLFFACTGTKNISKEKMPVVQLDTVNVYSDHERPAYQGSVTKYFDLINTKLDVSFNWKKQYLYGKATLTLTPYFYPQDSLILDAKGFDIHEVSILNGPDLPYNYKDGKKLRIKLNKQYTRKDTIEIFIDYTSKPNERTADGSSAITSDKGLYFINPLGKDSTKMREIWTQGESQSNSAWFPTFDSPNFRSHEEINMTVDTGFVTLSNGLLQYSELNGDGTRTDHWKMNKPIAPYLFMMAVGKYAVVQDKWEKGDKSIDVDYYVRPKYKKYAQQIFGNTPEMLTFYSNILGIDYPWSKFSQVAVQDYVSGAMENTTAVVIGSFIEQTSREMIDGNREPVLAHELFHHWFGDYVTTESWSNIPLNESFATMGEYLWIEHKYGEDAADEHLQQDVNSFLSDKSARTEPLIRYYYDPQHRESLFDVVSYQKGGAILQMLRKMVGDSAFFKSLNYYLKQNKLSTVEVAQLRLAFEKITGEDLHWFFNEWFFQNGYPDLNITYGYNDSTQKAFVFVDQNQNLDKNPLYQLPVAIDIYSNGKKERHFVTVDKKNQVYTFNAATKPDFINFDGQKMLLCKKHDHHTNEQWAYLYKNGSKYLDRYEAIQALGTDSSDFAHQIIKAALHDEFWKIRAEAIKYIPITLDMNRKGIKTTLIKIAKQDDKSSVRAQAIDELSLYYSKDEQVKELLVKLTKDSSYLVTATALENLYNIDSIKTVQIANNLANIDNGRVSIAVSNIFAHSGDSSKNQYFINKINSVENRYYSYKLVGNYEDYLNRMPEETVDASLPTLKKHALNENAWWVRLAYIKTLMEQQTRFQKKVDTIESEKAENKSSSKTNQAIKSKNLLDKIDAILAEIKHKEKSERLQKYMGN